MFWIKLILGYLLLLAGLLWLLHRAGGVLHTKPEPPPDSGDAPGETP